VDGEELFEYFDMNGSMVAVCSVIDMATGEVRRFRRESVIPL